jgi:DNA-3-methyladenine glycosylase
VALGITLADNGARLGAGATAAEEFRLDLPRQPVPFAAGPRTGVSGDGGSAAYPWRFWIPGDPSVSPYKASVPKKRPIRPSP